MPGKPKNNPKRKTNLMSPPPKLSFLVNTLKTTAIVTKKRNAPRPQRILMIKDEGLMINK